MIRIVRVDDRLLHGTVAQSWVAYYHIDTIVVVNDAVYDDAFSRVTLNLAKPNDVILNFMKLEDFIAEISTYTNNPNSNSMVIIENFRDLKEIYTIIPNLRSINIGGQRLRYSSNENLRINSYITLSNEDVITCKEILDKGYLLEVRQIPADSSIYLEKDQLWEK